MLVDTNSYESKDILIEVNNIDSIKLSIKSILSFRVGLCNNKDDECFFLSDFIRIKFDSLSNIDTIKNAIQIRIKEELIKSNDMKEKNIINDLIEICDKSDVFYHEYSKENEEEMKLDLSNLLGLNYFKNK